jgi:hypothetical protein
MMRNIGFDDAASIRREKHSRAVLGIRTLSVLLSGQCAGLAVDPEGLGAVLDLLGEDLLSLDGSADALL